MYYHHYMVASINNCHTLSDNFIKLKEEFAVEMVAQAGADPFGQASPIAEQMETTASKGCSLLCEEVMLDLKVRTEQQHYRANESHDISRSSKINIDGTIASIWDHSWLYISTYSHPRDTSLARFDWMLIIHSARFLLKLKWASSSWKTTLSRYSLSIGCSRFINIMMVWPDNSLFFQLID